MRPHVATRGEVVVLPFAGARKARDASLASCAALPLEASDHGVPGYLKAYYWWAYVHPAAVRIFERQWLANLILWGNYARLR